MVVPIVYAFGIFYIYRLTSVYQVSTQILLQNNDAYYRSNVVNESSFYTANSYIDNSNEQRVLLSYDLLNKVVDKLQEKLQLSYFIVGKVRTTEQFGGVPFKIQVNNIHPSFYERPIDFKIIDEENYEISFNSNQNLIVKKGQFNKELVDLDFNLLVTKSSELSKANVQSLSAIFYQVVIHSNDYLIGRIRSSINVSNPDYTNILEVSLSDIIPERAVLILDTLNNEYLKSKLISKIELNEKTIEYIDLQLDEISKLLKANVDTLQDYKQRKSIVNLTWEESDFLEKIGDYDKERSQAQLSLKSLSDLEKYIIEDKDPQFLPPMAFLSEREGFLVKAVEELYSKQIELSKISNQTTVTNPKYQDHIESIKKIKEDLLVYISNSRNATKSKIENINAQISKYIGEAKMIPPKQQELLSFQRKLTVNEGIYNFLLEKRANTRIARASIVPDAKIIESPRNIGEVSPNKPGMKKNFLSAGFGLAIIFIIIRVVFFDKIKSLEHLKELTSIPTLGVLPFLGKRESLGVIINEEPNSSTAEAFRSVRTNLQYGALNRSNQAVLVTSYMPSEGKTYISTNLAATVAKSGKKTIVLELDLHKPKVYKYLNIPAPTIGISTFISGMSTIEEIISETHIPNLFCIYAGPIPPNPSDFVLSEKLKELIEYAKSNFDLVIIDSPPAGILTDALYLMQFVDNSIFVLNTKNATKKTIEFVHEIVESNNLRNLFFVLNGVRSKGRRYYYQGYGYSYGYNYGYGYGYKSKN